MLSEDMIKYIFLQLINQWTEFNFIKSFSYITCQIQYLAKVNVSLIKSTRQLTATEFLKKKRSPTLFETFFIKKFIHILN